ncbi:calcium-binding protein [Salipiger sp. D13]|uniref:calcium-binding protein n=1 Tax=Salipiger sp. D13 TaxID=2364881 RepID=UPI000FFB553C|nr:calcium-binding protein [Salipiger sp. D13]
MPLTPETWRGETLVNSTSAGTDTDSQIIQLTNGNILVVWTAYNGTNYDVWGRIYDPFGAEVSGELYLANTSNDEDFPAIDALPDGGFVLVHEDDTGSFDDIRLRQFDANGVQETSSYAFFDGSSGGANPNGFIPEVASSSSTSTLVLWQETDASGESVLRGRIWNSDTETFDAAAFDVITSEENIFYLDVDVLSNGNYVIAASVFDAGLGETHIEMRILAPDGSNVLGASYVGGTNSDGDGDIDPTVTALAGGGYVIAWRNQDGFDDDIIFQVFDSTGSSTTGVLSATFGTNNANEPELVALADGGFLIIYDEDTLNQLIVQRYDSSGSQVGSNFVISNAANANQPSATLLADGRVAISYTLGGQIYTQIIDTRDNATEGDMPLNGDENDYWVGTVGDDTFTVSNGRGDVHGWDGNDDITESGAIRNYFGGEGDDTLRVSSPINSDLHDGGNGIDLIDWSGSGVSNGTFDLEAGTATNGFSTESMVDFEQLRGTTNADTILGLSSASDTLSGDGGDDIIDGRGGNDLLEGDAGNDILDGGAGNDSLNGGADDDTLIGGSGTDTLNGGSGTDTADYSGNGIGGVIDLFGGTATFGAITEDLISIENAIGGAGNDELIGNGVNNLLQGGAGNDTLRADSDAGDTLLGEAGDDFIEAIGVSGSGLADGGSGNDTIAMIDGYYAGDADGGADTDTFDASAITGSGMYLDLAAGTHEYVVFSGLSDLLNFENVIGTQLADTITGDGGDNILEGEAGADSIAAGLGNDTVYGDSGSDTLFGDDGNDSLYGGDDADTIGGGIGNDFLAGQSGNDYIAGGGNNDTAYGGGGDDYIDGGTGDDLLAGNAGADSILGRDGSDTLLGGDGNDTLLGLSGDDEIFGEDGDDSMLGGDGNDSLGGEFGNDTLDGGSGADTLNGYDGADSILGGSGNDEVIGGTGHDYMAGQSGDDSLYAGGGSDSVYGGSGNDTLDGSAGYDTVAGGTGNDLMYGGANDDYLLGEDGNDTGYGDDGDDYLNGGDGADRLYGGNGNDEVIGGTGHDYMAGQSGNDSLYAGGGSDSVYGGSGDDTLDGSAGYDTVAGGTGNDLMYGGDHDDYLLGEDGNDTGYGDAGDDYLSGADGADSLSGGDGQDSVYGGAGSDTLYGGSGDDVLDGGQTGDWLYGQSGNDTLDGGRGWDRLYGGGGADVFLFSEINAGENDTIADFADGTDLIEIAGGYAFGDLTITTVGSTAEIDVDGHTITVFGASAGDFSSADFIFS